MPITCIDLNKMTCHLFYSAELLVKVMRSIYILINPLKIFLHEKNMCIYYLVNIVTVDELVTYESRAAWPMILTLSGRNYMVLTWPVFKNSMAEIHFTHTLFAYNIWWYWINYFACLMWSIQYIFITCDTANTFVQWINKRLYICLIHVS